MATAKLRSEPRIESSLFGTLGTTPSTGTDDPLGQSASRLPRMVVEGRASREEFPIPQVSTRPNPASPLPLPPPECYISE